MPQPSAAALLSTLLQAHHQRGGAAGTRWCHASSRPTGLLRRRKSLSGSTSCSGLLMCETMNAPLCCVTAMHWFLASTTAQLRGLPLIAFGTFLFWLRIIARTLGVSDT